MARPDLVVRPGESRCVNVSSVLTALQLGERGQWRIERVKLEEYIASCDE